MSVCCILELVLCSDVPFSFGDGHPDIPNNLKRGALLELFDTLGFQGLYDYVYLPIDFFRQANVGYTRPVE